MHSEREIEQNLIEQKKLYTLIADIELKKSEAISMRSLKDMETLTQKEENLLKEIETLEGERLYTVWKYAEKAGISAKASLSEIAKTATDSTSAERLMDAGHALKKAVFKVKHLKETNEKLMNENLELFNGLIAGLKNITGIRTGYDKEGKESSRVVNSVLLNTTA